MNIREKDLLRHLLSESYDSQRALAAETGYSLGTVSQSLNHLVSAGYLTGEYCLTEKAREEAKRKKPKNAVILAAGFGLRMIPINREIPKGLVEVRGEALIERLIRQLHEAGVFDITVVVGFMKEAYEYLIDLYGVELLVNQEYAGRNNLYSLALAAEKLSNTYIIPCDIWCQENPFSDTELYSWYMVTELTSDDSFVRVNRKKELAAVEKERSGNEMIGISYLLEEDALWLRESLVKKAEEKQYRHSFWEEACMKDGKMIFHARVASADKVYEINTYENLRDLDGSSQHLDSEVLKKIAEALECGLGDIVEISVLKKGMTNRSFQFRCKEKRYIMRIPGEGTERLIDRNQEYEVYQAVKELGLSDTVRYFDPENGYKLTEFIQGARVCDSQNPEDVEACMRVLREFHNSGASVGHEFPVFEKIEFYESLWEGQPSAFRDHAETKRKIWELKEYIESQPVRRGLCHIDSVPDNFLISENGIRLIDWEYAGMQDTDIDIAMFAVYAMYDRKQVEELIEAYYQEGCPSGVRRKIYAYIAVCGFLWSNWCEFKRQKGVEFGEYSIRQYRYAKEYYKIWKEA